MKTSVNQVAAFGKLVGFCNAHGPMYNPSKASIKVAALDSLLTSAGETLTAANVSRTAFENAIIARVQAFDELPALSSRMLAALRACGASVETLSYARNIRRSFHSKRKVSPASAPATGEVSGAAVTNDLPKRSFSQVSYDSKVNNFARLVERMSIEPLYQPNEVDLQIPALEAFVTKLRNANNGVINAVVARSNARITRNNLLFGPNGIHGIAMEVKDYLKSVFGPSSEQYKQVSPLRFRTINY